MFYLLQDGCTLRLTDGQVSNTATVIDFVREHATWNSESGAVAGKNGTKKGRFFRSSARSVASARSGKGDEAWGLSLVWAGASFSSYPRVCSQIPNLDKMIWVLYHHELTSLNLHASPGFLGSCAPEVSCRAVALKSAKARGTNIYTAPLLACCRGNEEST